MSGQRVPDQVEERAARFNELKTANLDQILKSGQADVNQVTKSYLDATEITFVQYMDVLIKQKGISKKELFRRADLHGKSHYAYLTGEKHTPDRDRILRILIALEVSLEDCNRALELYGMQPLYSKCRRDMVIITFINRKMRGVDRLNEFLLQYGEVELTDFNKLADKFSRRKDRKK